MRHPLTTVSAAMIAAGLTFTQAFADPGRGWVDPPAKDPGSKAIAPVKPEAPPQAAQAPSAQGTPASSPVVAQTPAAAPQSIAKPEPATATARAGGAKPDRSREVRRSIRQTPTPLAFTPSPAAPANDPRFIEWAGRAQRLTTNYLDSVSSPNAVSLAEAARFYAPQVRRFGRMETLAAVLADKRRFAKRWPERRYAAQADAIRTACNAAQQACIVRTTYEYQAGNAARGARAQGVAELVLEISFADGRPVIVSESSRVLRRGASAAVTDGASRRGA